MFKGTGVTMRVLLGKEGGSRCEVGGEYIKKREFSKKGIQKKKSIRKRRVKRRTLREECEQCILLCNIGLLKQTCN